MENSLTFRFNHYDHSARVAIACEFTGPDGKPRRNAVKIGKGGQSKAKADLIAWAKGRGWNG